MTAAALAAELEVSVRSVYRDMADLIGRRVPIEGEAGVGYVLDHAFDMPPLMLTPDEIEAAVLGAQWVAMRADPMLARAAQDLLAKIEAGVPERLRPVLLHPTVGAATPRLATPDNLDMAQLRLWIRGRRKVRIRYLAKDERESERTIWPVLVGYAESLRLLAAWCELRQAFRHFRTDRILAAEFLDETTGCRPGELRTRWRRYMETERGIRLR